jgi:hypothetical protein
VARRVVQTGDARGMRRNCTTRTIALPSRLSHIQLSKMSDRLVRLHSSFRGVLIGYGVAFFSWFFNRTLPEDETSRDWSAGSGYMIGIGLALQLLMLLVKWLVGRYERDHGMEGMLQPQAVAIVQLLIDGITVLLFAIGTFRSIALFAQL